MADVAVVVCNYNKRDYVIDCITSIFESEFNRFDLIVVDNASTDGSHEAIKERFGGKLTLLANGENTGGAGGFSRGMDYVMAKGRYKYIHLLDNDVVIDSRAIGALYDFMEKRPDAGVCGSLVCRMDSPDTVQDLGAVIDLDNLVTAPLYGGAALSAGLPELAECDYVASCSAMYRISALKKTGVMDRDFFIYWDDVSLSWEMRLSGYKVYAYSKSVVWHNRTSAKRTGFNRYYSLRNKIYCFTRYLGGKEFDKFRDTLVRMMFRTIIVNLKNPQTLQSYIHALMDGLNNVRGKAEPNKVFAADETGARLQSRLSGKKKIAVICPGGEGEYIRIAGKLKAATDAEITNIPDRFCDVVVMYCHHILDIEKYDRSYIYIDKYENQILDESDFECLENYGRYIKFYNMALAGYISSKLDELREKIAYGQ